MIVYLFLLLITVGPLLYVEQFFEKGKLKIKKWSYSQTRVAIYIFSCVLLLLFAVFRDISVGADYSRYRSHFYSENFYSKYEPLFYLIARIISFIIPTFNCFSDFILGLSLVLIFTMIYLNRGKLWIGIFFLQATYAYALIFSAMRQALALAVLSIALMLLYSDKNKTKMLIAATVLILLAALFHYSAIFCMAIIVAYLIKDRFKFYMPITFFSITVLVFGEKLLNLALVLTRRHGHYLQYKPNWGRSTIAYIVAMMLLIFVPRIFKKKRTLLKIHPLQGDELMLFNVLMFALLFNLFFVFIPSHFRINMYFYLAFAFLYMRIFDAERKSDLLVIVVTAIYYVYQLCFDAASVIPYSFHFGPF